MNTVTLSLIRFKQLEKAEQALSKAMSEQTPTYIKYYWSDGGHHIYVFNETEIIKTLLSHH